MEYTSSVCIETFVTGVSCGHILFAMSLEAFKARLDGALVQDVSAHCRRLEQDELDFKVPFQLKLFYDFIILLPKIIFFSIFMTLFSGSYYRVCLATQICKTNAEYRHLA